MKGDWDCLVIHDGTKNSDIPRFEYRCRFTYMDLYVDSVYILDVDRVMTVKDIIPCGSRKSASNLPDFMIYVSDGYTEKGLEEADEEDFGFEIAAEEVEDQKNNENEEP